VREGTILKITCDRQHEGTTSVSYSVAVIDEKAGRHAIFTTRVTFVSVDDAGGKRPIRA
jgi:acyl-CoA hydrolase